ncbi:MAG: hypothetical protein KDD51_15135, partial [Bdellovibrionales bacterium]|nr:hypothetical protein [Bdellovibrionales bacterium]
SSRTLPEVVEELMWVKDGNQYLLNRELWNDHSLYRRGRELMRRTDPKFQLYKINVEGVRFPQCADEVTDPS